MDLIHFYNTSNVVISETNFKQSFIVSYFPTNDQLDGIRSVKLTMLWSNDFRDCRLLCKSQENAQEDKEHRIYMR